MNKVRRFENLTHLELRAQPQLAAHQFASRSASLPTFELFNAARCERWVAALRAGADASECAQQHRDAQLNTIALQRAPANKSH